MSTETNANPDIHEVTTPLYDPIGMQGDVALQGTLVTTDPATGIKYAPGVLANQVMAAILAGKGFVASTGPQTSPGAYTEGLSVFNPAASGKTLYFFSVKVGNGSSGQHTLYDGITVDPALGVVITSRSEIGGGPLSVASVSYANAAVNIAIPTNIHETVNNLAATTTDFLDPDEIIICPPGYGLLLAVKTNTGTWMATMKWWEQ
jgi:hypothetical protein